MPPIPFAAGDRPPDRPPEPAVARLLRDLGPRLRAGGDPPEPRDCLPSGLPEIDRLLGGGFPRGRLCEIAGPPSAGRTSLALSLLARTTAAEEVCAVVDAADGFDPLSAAAAGVVLERVLWARPVPGPRLSEALRGAERLLEAQGFALVLLDPGGRERAVPRSAWARLARTAAASGSTLVVLSRERAAGPQAEVALELGALRAHFAGTPLLLEAIEIEVVLVRQRGARPERSALLRLGAA
jgi:RecA/RadA recombinase